MFLFIVLAHHSVHADFQHRNMICLYSFQNCVLNSSWIWESEWMFLCCFSSFLPFSDPGHHQGYFDYVLSSWNGVNPNTHSRIGAYTVSHIIDLHAPPSWSTIKHNVLGFWINLHQDEESEVLKIAWIVLITLFFVMCFSDSPWTPIQGVCYLLFLCDFLKKIQWSHSNWTTKRCAISGL